ncbi:pilin [Pseudomonas sp. KNUC1026]|uniref:pilin n=1 Tax=Pseudomonas sp. KNUC1026 TaxID=2893890 RepID=UPI003FA7D754
MIVIAIISILAAIAFPVYSQFQVKSKVAASLAELSALQVNVDQALAGGKTSPNLADIGADTLVSASCSVSISSDANGQYLACTIVNPPAAISGGILSLRRDPAGVWTCSANTSISLNFLPKGCKSQ